MEKLFQTNQDASLTLLTSVLDDGAHYGRIVRDENGHVQAIVEAKDCTEEQKKICEINAGMYCFKNRWMRNRINNNWLKEGVQIVDPKRTVIGKDVKIGHDVIIHPNVEILGKTEIGDFVEILPGSYLNNSKIENCAVVDSSKIVDSCISEGTIVGPMSYVSNNKIIK